MKKRLPMANFVRNAMQVFCMLTFVFIFSGCGMFKDQNDCGCFSDNKEVREAPVQASSNHQKSPVAED